MNNPGFYGNKKEDASKVPTRVIGLDARSGNRSCDATLNNCMEALINNGWVAFSRFPMNGEIMQDVLGELGIKNVLVKEISCLKFILSLKIKHKEIVWIRIKLVDGYTVSRGLRKLISGLRES